jgi:hypothetical protein
MGSEDGSRRRAGHLTGASHNERLQLYVVLQADHETKTARPEGQRASAPGQAQRWAAMGQVRAQRGQDV